MPEPIEIECDCGFEDDWGGECGFGWDGVDDADTCICAMVTCFTDTSAKYWENSS